MSVLRPVRSALAVWNRFPTESENPVFTMPRDIRSTFPSYYNALTERLLVAALDAARAR